VSARVGIDVRALCEEGPEGEDGLYALRMLRALLEEEHSYRLVLLGYGRYEDCLPQDLWGVLEWRRVARPFPGTAALMPLQQQVLAFTVREAGLDLFHAMSRDASPFIELPSLVTVRRFLPPAFRPPARGPREPFMRLSLRAAARRADRVVVPSGHLARELREAWGLGEGRTVVVPEGVGEEFRPPADREKKRLSLVPLGIDRPYFLYVGDGGPASNLRVLLLALRRAVLREGKDLQAVLALQGAAPRKDILHDVIISTGLEKRVVVLPSCPRSLLPTLYGGALALACLDLHGGSHLPVLEAMACGTPVLAARASSLPESVGNAALLVDPADAGAVAGRMGELARRLELRRELSERGRKHAAGLGWRAVARRLLETYGEILDERGRR